MAAGGFKCMYIWNEMTREEIQETQHGLVIITIGATEQHGPHLPVATDNIIVEAIAKESVEKSSTSIPIILGPNIPFGFSHHHYLYAGAISLSIQTLLIVLKEVMDSLIKSGFNKIFILNSHGGNDEIIRLTAKEVAYEHGVNIGAASYWTLTKEALATYRINHQLYEVGHAGQFETSLILAIKPEQVKLDQLNQDKTERKVIDLTFDEVVKMKSKSIWEEIDGYSDAPLKAQKQMGEELLGLISGKVSEEFIEFYRDIVMQ